MKNTGKTRPSESSKYGTYEFTETEAIGKEPAWVFSGFSVYISVQLALHFYRDSDYENS